MTLRMRDYGASRSLKRRPNVRFCRHPSRSLQWARATDPIQRMRPATKPYGFAATLGRRQRVADNSTEPKVAKRDFRMRREEERLSPTSVLSWSCASGPPLLTPIFRQRSTAASLQRAASDGVGRTKRIGTLFSLALSGAMANRIGRKGVEPPRSG